jgi:hypothetical protein
VSIQVAESPDGLLTVEIKGTLTKPDLERAQSSAVDVIRKHGKVRVLVITTNFLGWAREDDWSDVGFPAEHDKHIQKIAIVGDRRWEDLVVAFTGKGFRPPAIQYFATADLARARAWVGAGP